MKVAAQIFLVGLGFILFTLGMEYCTAKENKTEVYCDTYKEVVQPKINTEKEEQS